MHVIIGGFGRVGRQLAFVLETQGHSVTVIDRDPTIFIEHGEEIRGRKLAGEVFDRDTLIKAGIEKADAFAAVTSGDNSNIVSARVARERFNVPTVVARIYDPRRATIYQRFGIPTVSTVQWAAAQLIANILEPELTVHSTYAGGELITLRIDAAPSAEGKSIADLDHPGRFQVTAVVREGKGVLPDPALEIVKGDHLFVTATRESLDELKQLLGLS